jgi:hypothetical protein
MRFLRRLALGMCIAFASAGCGPPWTVLIQAVPSPMAGQTRFAVLPVAMPNLQVGDGSVRDHLADKDAEQRASWAEDMGAINEEFTRHLIDAAAEEGISVVPATGPGAAPFEIRPEVIFVEPGYYVGVSAGASKVKMMVRVTQSDGSVLDEILIEHSTPGSLSNPSATNRLRDDAEGLGKITAEYLTTRVFAQ